MISRDSVRSLGPVSRGLSLTKDDEVYSVTVLGSQSLEKGISRSLIYVPV